MLAWSFLTDKIDENALILDCRSEKAYEAGTVRNALGAAAVKKPYGSGPKSMGLLTGLLDNIKSKAEGKSSVICFDEGQGMYASRMAWMLRADGFKDVRILASKFADIPADELGPGKGQIPAEAAAKARSEYDGLISIGDLQKNLTKVQLLDVRTPQEFEGQLPRMVNPEPGGICGRVPGSMNWDWRLLYGPDGSLKDRNELVMGIRSIGLIQERPTVIYDYNGARSCTAALVLFNCGYRQVQVYLGSWMEWRKSNLPKQNFHTWQP